MKTNNIYKTLLLSIISMITLPILAQSGSYTLTTNNLNIVKSITVPANVPIKITCNFNQNVYVDIWSDNDEYEGDGPDSWQFTTTSSQGNIFIYCADEGNGGPYTFTLNWVAGSYSAVEDSYIHGNSVVDGNISVGALSSSGKLGIVGMDKQVSIYSYNYNQSPYGSYGLNANISNSSGPVYGVYSYVSGGGSSNQRWSGYFYGGDLVVNSGKIGVGTTSPKANMDVIGEIKSTLSGVSNIRMTGGTYSSLLRNDGSNTYLLFTNNNDVNGSWNALRPFTINNSTGNVSFADGKFQITHSSGNIIASGKIGIGLTDAVTKLAASPSDELLTVNGVIHAKEIKVDLTGSLADYVFDENYQLMPLNKVEEYVNANNHLPEIPSATEVKDKGMNMGEMQNKLLKKIEELTLYVIEQHKRIEALEKNQK